MTESTMKAPKKALRPVKWMRENLFSGNVRYLNGFVLMHP